MREICRIGFLVLGAEVFIRRDPLGVIGADRSVARRLGIIHPGADFPIAQQRAELAASWGDAFLTARPGPANDGVGIAHLDRGAGHQTSSPIAFLNRARTLTPARRMGKSILLWQR